MFPIWRTPDDNAAPIETLANFSGQPLPTAGALACLSDDANWLLVWPLQSDRHQGGADAGVRPTHHPADCLDQGGPGRGSGQ